MNVQQAVTAYEQALQNRKDGDAEEDNKVMKKPSAKTVPSAKKTPGCKTAPKSILKKPTKSSSATSSTWTKAKGGWQVEVRLRGSGTQSDAYYHAPDGSRFRIKGDAVKYGFKG